MENRLGIILLVLAAVLVRASGVHADTVTLRDGTIYTGHIVADELGYVDVDTVMGSVRVTIRVPRVRVADVDRSPLPGGFFALPTRERPIAPAHETAAHVELASPTGTRVLGPGQAARALERAADLAISRGYQQLVVQINLAGLSSIEAEACVAIIADAQQHLHVTAVVEQATGAATLIPLACDDIVMAQEAVIGGWIIRRRPAPGARALPDIARNELIAEQLAGSLRGRALQPEVFRAMTSASCELVLIRAPERQPVEDGPKQPVCAAVAFASAVHGDQEALQLCSKGQPLRLRAGHAQMLCLAVQSTQASAEAAAQWHIEDNGWVHVTDIAARAAQHAERVPAGRNAQAAALSDELETLYSTFAALLAQGDVHAASLRAAKLREDIADAEQRWQEEAGLRKELRTTVLGQLDQAFEARSKKNADKKSDTHPHDAHD